MAISIEEYKALVAKANADAERESTKHHKSPEHDIQVRFVNWFRYSYPDRFVTAIPNAAKRSARAGAYMKAEGLTAGMPDLLFPAASKGYNCLWIELKNGTKGTLRQSQIEMHECLSKQGNLVKVARSFEDCVKIVRDYFD